MLSNKTKQTPIIKKTKHADNWLKKARGLMLEKRKNFNYALIFSFKKEVMTRASIHSLFVFFPFLAVYLDSEKRVVDLAKIEPFSLNYTPQKKAKYLIELPLEKGKKIELNNKLKF